MQRMIMTCQISSTRSSHDVDEPSSVTENVQSNVFSVLTLSLTNDGPTWRQELSNRKIIDSSTRDGKEPKIWVRVRFELCKR